MEEKYIKFYKTFHKKFKNDKNLILCSKTLNDGGVGSKEGFSKALMRNEKNNCSSLTASLINLFSSRRSRRKFL